MNIVEYTKVFHHMEMEAKLFELKTSDNIYFWDIVRYDVFFSYIEVYKEKKMPMLVI